MKINDPLLIGACFLCSLLFLFSLIFFIFWTKTSEDLCGGGGGGGGGGDARPANRGSGRREKCVEMSWEVQFKGFTKEWGGVEM